jgi:parallel beta-helix repeat protein
MRYITSIQQSSPRNVETGILPLLSWVVLLLMSTAIPFASAAVLEVGEGQDYELVMDAVTAAAPHDTVMIHNGDYIENVDITIPLTLTSVNGAEFVTISTSIDWEDVIDVTADSVFIEGISVYGAVHGNGIHYYYAVGGAVRNCRAGWEPSSSNMTGIYMAYADDIILEYNTCSYNGEIGIYLYGTEEAIARNNSCNYNVSPVYEEASGIRTYATVHTFIHNNQCVGNDIGIQYAYNSWNDSITSNSCNDNRYGLWSYFQTRLNISGNSFNDNSQAGIFMSGVHRCTVAGNEVMNNSHFAMRVLYCQSNHFFLNDYAHTADTLFYFTDGSNQIFQAPSLLAFNTGESTIKSYLGNYYDCYPGSDDDNDGIGDTPYEFGDFSDAYPLMGSGSDAASLTWFPGAEGMTRGDMGTVGGYEHVDPGGTVLWVADEAVLSNLTFPAGLQDDSTSWTGFLMYEYNEHPELLLEFGSWDGATFTPGGPEVMLEGFVNYYIHRFATTASQFMVPEGHYLAVRGTLYNEDRDFNFHRGGAWAFFSAPEGTPHYPGLEAVGDLPEQPESFDLQLSNYPNPFNPTTTIEFTLPFPQEVELTVYNVTGQRVAILADGMYQAGIHRVTFDTNSWAGLKPAPAMSLPSGVYIYRLTAGDNEISKKMILVQ